MKPPIARPWLNPCWLLLLVSAFGLLGAIQARAATPVDPAFAADLTAEERAWLDGITLRRARATGTADRATDAPFRDSFERYPRAQATQRGTNAISDAKALEGESVAAGKDYSGYRLQWQIGIMALLVIAVILFWNRKLAAARSQIESERSAVQQSLRRQEAAEEFARATIDALSAHLCVLDENGVVITVNQAWRDFADANPPPPANYCVGANYLGTCRTGCAEPEGAKGEFLTQLDAVLHGEQTSFAFEYPCHSPQEQRWFVAHVSRFEIDGKTRVVVAHEDITPRKQAEQKLRRFSQSFEAFLNQTSDFIYFKDEDSRFIFCSQTMADITHHDHWREMIGKHDREVFPPDTAAIYEARPPRTPPKTPTFFGHLRAEPHKGLSPTSIRRYFPPGIFAPSPDSLRHSCS